MMTTASASRVDTTAKLPVVSNANTASTSSANSSQKFAQTLSNAFDGEAVTASAIGSAKSSATQPATAAPSSTAAVTASPDPLAAETATLAAVLPQPVAAKSIASTIAHEAPRSTNATSAEPKHALTTGAAAAQPSADAPVATTTILVPALIPAQPTIAASIAAPAAAAVSSTRPAVVADARLAKDKPLAGIAPGQDTAATGASGATPVITSPAPTLAIAMKTLDTPVIATAATLPHTASFSASFSASAKQEAAQTLTMATASAHAEPTLTTVESAKPNQLEVGVRGGEFGWVKVRAEVAADGSVSAYLRGPAAATGQLHAQATGIQAYLGTQNVSVQSVQVEVARASAGLNADSFSGGSQSQTRGSQSQTSSSQSQTSGSQSQTSGSQSQTGDDQSASPQTSSGVEAAEESAERLAPLSWLAGQSTTLSGTGGWLSIRA
jgi:hypothetical protein